MLVPGAKLDGGNKDNYIHFVAPPDVRNTTYLVNEKEQRKAEMDLPSLPSRIPAEFWRRLRDGICFERFYLRRHG